MALSARGGNILRIDARLGIVHESERMLTMAIRAGGTLHLTFFQRLPVNTDLVFIVDLHVAPAAHLPHIDPVGA